MLNLINSQNQNPLYYSYSWTLCCLPTNWIWWTIVDCEYQVKGWIGWCFLQFVCFCFCSLWQSWWILCCVIWVYFWYCYYCYCCCCHCYYHHYHYHYSCPHLYLWIWIWIWIWISILIDVVAIIGGICCVPTTKIKPLLQ